MYNKIGYSVNKDLTSRIFKLASGYAGGMHLQASDKTVHDSLPSYGSSYFNPTFAIRGVYKPLSQERREEEKEEKGSHLD